MKRPDSWKHESWLRRILDSSLFDSLIHFEECVLADSTTLQAKGYFLFVVTETSFFYIQSGKDTGINTQQSWQLTDIHSLQHLNDAATFFGGATEISQSTKHLRLYVSDQVPSSVSMIDFYSFYEDSLIYTHLKQAWQQAHSRLVLPRFYPQHGGTTTERMKLTKLSKLGVQGLYMHMEAQLLATTKEEEEDANAAAAASAAATAAANSSAESKTSLAPPATPAAGAKRKKPSDHAYWDVRLRTRLLEEMTLAVGVHRSFKQLCFNSLTLIPFLLRELKKYNKFRSYLLGCNPNEIWSYISHHEDRLIDDELDELRLVIAIYCFFSRLLAGSECIPERTKLIAWNSTTTEREVQEVMDTLFMLGGIPVYSSSSTNQNLSVPPATPMGGTSSSSKTRTVTPSAFLETLDMHLEQHPSSGSNSLTNTHQHATIHDEDDERYKQKYLYNIRTQRQWKESILHIQSDIMQKDASHSTNSSTKQKLLQSSSNLHIRDIQAIIHKERETRHALLLKRGPARIKKGDLNTDQLYDAPLTADEVGYESVVAANSAHEQQGLQQLRNIIPELEVMYMELLHHFQELLEYVLNIGHPTLKYNLETCFKYMLDMNNELSNMNSSENSDHNNTSLSMTHDFKLIQLPVFSRGLIYMCKKERRDVISYYTFIYASVISKFMIRSTELQRILYQQEVGEMMTNREYDGQVTQQQKDEKKSSTASQLTLLPDIKSSVLSSNARGLHFYQCTKPLLEQMVKLLRDG